MDDTLSLYMGLVQISDKFPLQWLKHSGNEYQILYLCCQLNQSVTLQAKRSHFLRQSTEVLAQLTASYPMDSSFVKYWIGRQHRLSKLVLPIVAQKIKCWPADLAISSSSPALVDRFYQP